MNGQKIRLMALLFLLVPTIAILLSLHWALENDELARRRELVDLSTGYLKSLRQQLATEMKKGAADAAVLLDEKARVLFPRLTPYPGRKLTEKDQCPTGRGRLIYRKALSLGNTEESIEMLECFLREKSFAQLMTVDGYHLLSLVCCQALEWLPRKDERRHSFTKKLTELLNDWESPIPAVQLMSLTRKMRMLAPEMKIPARNGLALALAYVRANPSRPAVPNELQRTGRGAVWHKLSVNGRRIELFHETSIRGRLREALSKLSMPGFEIELITPGAKRKTKGSLLTSMALLPPLSGWSLQVVSSQESNFGHRRWLLVWSALLIVLLGIVTTISTTNALEAHLTETNLKNSLVTNVSHELRTPLAAMQVLVETLEDERTKSEEQNKEYVKLLNVEIARLNRLVENFLSYSRMESGNISYKKEAIELEELVEEAVLAMGCRLEKANCNLRVSMEEDLPQLMGDKAALVISLVNLLDNALKYGGESNDISVSVKTVEGDLHLAVADEGPGVPPEDAKRIFERFYRCNDRATSVSGSGLGLAIVHHVVKGHGGTIAVDEPPGAKFTILIPTMVN